MLSSQDADWILQFISDAFRVVKGQKWHTARDGLHLQIPFSVLEGKMSCRKWSLPGLSRDDRCELTEEKAGLKERI